MKKSYFLTLLVLLVAFPAMAYAELKDPKVTAKQGQTQEQQAKDIMECRAMAIQETGVNPDALKMQMRTLESSLSYQARPVPTLPGGRGGTSGSTLPPERYKEVQQTKDRMKEIEKQYKTYVGAFSDKMEARGYKVK